jgi:hypothetical protein
MSNIKLGIYGDSYADSRVSDTAWPNLLKHYPGYSQVDCYAESGSSVYFSYKQFLNTHTNYDRIVFIFTGPYRWHHWVINPGFQELANDHRIHIPNPDQIERYEGIYADQMTGYFSQYLQALKDYYFVLNNNEICTDLAEAMLFHVQTLRPDAIIIPITAPLYCVQSTAHLTPMADYNKLILRSLFDEEIDWDSFNFFKKYKELKTVSCHFTPEVNVLVAQHIDHAIQTSQWAPNIPDKLSHDYPLDYYYSKIPSDRPWYKF